MRKTMFSEDQITVALRQADAGTSVEEICRKLGIAESTFFRWKKQFGGLGVGELREMRHLRDENWLKGAVADLTLDKAGVRSSFCLQVDCWLGLLGPSQLRISGRACGKRADAGARLPVSAT